MKCARTACPNTLNIIYKHPHDGRMYCPKCAKLISRHNPGLHFTHVYPKAVMPTQVNLTPKAFDPSNPKAQENIAKVNDAAEKLENIISRKADFANELYETVTSDGESLAHALFRVLHGRRYTPTVNTDDRNAYDGYQELETRWKELQKEHSRLHEQLVMGMCGQ